MRRLLRLWLGLLAASLPGVPAQQTGNHPEWDRWCGKVYKAGFPSFDPGGQTQPPTPVPGPPLLDIQFRPRYSLYLSNEEAGEFIVNAPLSQFFGQAIPDSTASSSSKFTFTISLASTSQVLVNGTLPLNTTGTLFPFPLSPLTPSLDPIPLLLTGSLSTSSSSSQTWKANTTILYLPTKSTGSVTRLDNLNGGFHHSSPFTHHTFTPFLPYGFYASYDNFLANVTPSNHTAIDAYSSLGLNAMTPLTIFRDGAPALDYMNSLDLRFMYDLREGYKNLTYVSSQAVAARDSPALFAYWSADEPDGWQDPFSAPVATQQVLHELDPYHPVAVVLNCQDYYFGEYAQGADVIMEDVYPIGINASFSKWGTACNETLGDCGCDNCSGLGPIDVSERLDTLRQYERWLNLWPKTKIHNPQSFSGEGYWARDPTPEEEWAMVLLAVNHGAKGIISWVWPASDVLGKAHGELAKVLTGSEVGGLVVGERAETVETGTEGVDVAVWKGREGKWLVSVVNSGYEDVGRVDVRVKGARAVRSVPWGEGGKWTLERGVLSVTGLKALETTLLVLDGASCGIGKGLTVG